MSDWGMKVSRQGYPVRTAADHQLLFSSSFKMPMVIGSGTLTGYDRLTDQTLFTHNLGFTPCCYLFARNSSSAPDRLHLDTGNTDLNGALFTDNTKLWYKGNQFDSNYPISWFCFNIPLLTAYTAPSIVTTDATQGTISNDYGFKISKAGNDVLSADLADLQIFSGTSEGNQPVRNQIFQKIGSGTVNDGSTATISHGLNYRPMFIVFINDPTTTNGYFIDAVTYKIIGGSFVERWRSWADTTNINIRNNSGTSQSYAYMIFKDPLL